MKKPDDARTLAATFRETILAFQQHNDDLMLRVWAVQNLLLDKGLISSAEIEEEIGRLRKCYGLEKGSQREAWLKAFDDYEGTKQ